MSQLRKQAIAIPDDLKEIAAELQQRIQLFSDSPMTDGDSLCLELIGRISREKQRADDAEAEIHERTLEIEHWKRETNAFKDTAIAEKERADKYEEEVRLEHRLRVERMESSIHEEEYIKRIIKERDEAIAALKAMTEDRDLWQGEHNSDCPNLLALEYLKQSLGPDNHDVQEAVLHKLDIREKFRKLEDSNAELRKTLESARWFVDIYAQKNPKWKPANMEEQDPMGVHRLLEKIEDLLKN